MKFPSLKKIGKAIARAGDAISAAATAVGHSISRHWALTAAIVLSLVAFAAVTAALVFLWPAAIGAAAGLAVTLPFFGTVAPLAFLGTLSVPAAAAVLGAFAFGATLLASAVINGFAAIYNAFDRKATGGLPENQNRGGKQFFKVGELDGKPLYSIQEMQPTSSGSNPNSGHSGGNDVDLSRREESLQSRQTNVPFQGQGDRPGQFFSPLQRRLSESDLRQPLRHSSPQQVPLTGYNFV